MKIFLGFSLLSLVFMPFAVQAVNIWEGTSGGGCNNNPKGCNLCDALKVAASITNFLIQMSFVIVAAMIIWGAIRIMLPPGDSKSNLAAAKKIFTSAVWGLVIVLASWAIINTTFHVLTGKPGYPWDKIECYKK